MEDKKIKKKLSIGLFVLVLIALVFWAISRWDVWFHNPEELPYSPSDKPYNVLLTFGDSSEWSRNISWQCDSVVRPSHLELALLPDGDTIKVDVKGEVFRSRAGKAAYYVARIRSLKPSAHYAYRVITGNHSSSWFHFTTQSQMHKSLSFVYVGDVQDTIAGKANFYLREALKRHPESEFLVCGGDLTERPTTQNWAETFRDVDSIAQNLPLVCVTGNHDYLKGVIVRLEKRFSLVFSYYLDSMIGDNQVFTFNYGPAQFFLLDSNREFPYLLTQRRWLKEKLSASSARWKILVLHHPLFSIRGGRNLIQRWVFNDLLEEYGVDLVLQGHEHAYARMTNHKDDGTAATPIYIVRHCSPKNYRIDFDDRFDKFGISSRYYQTVSITDDTLAYATYEVYNHTLYDSLQIIKDKSGNASIFDLGSNIPEYMEFEPQEGNKKDKAFAKRIDEYRRKHPERVNLQHK